MAVKKRELGANATNNPNGSHNPTVPTIPTATSSIDSHIVGVLNYAHIADVHHDAHLSADLLPVTAGMPYQLMLSRS